MCTCDKQIGDIDGHKFYYQPHRNTWTFASILSVFLTCIPGHIGVDEAELSVRPTEIWFRLMPFIETFWVEHYVAFHAPIAVFFVIFVD